MHDHDHRLRSEHHEFLANQPRHRHGLSDGATLETPTVSGNTSDGYMATLTIGVSV
jgi:hypothetical protein